MLKILGQNGVTEAVRGLDNECVAIGLQPADNAIGVLVTDDFVKFNQKRWNMVNRSIIIKLKMLRIKLTRVDSVGVLVILIN